jgi:hypothetical protein
VKILPPHLFTAVALLICFCPHVNAKGIAAIKAHETHTNASARVFVFEKVRDTGAVIIFDVKGRKPYSVIRSPKVDYLVIIDDLSADITDDKGIATFKDSLNQSKAFARKYPKTKTMVAPYIELLSEVIGKYDKGLVRRDGQWISKDEYRREKADEVESYKRGEVKLIKSKISSLEDKVEGYEEDLEAIQKEIEIKRVQRLYLKAQQWLQKESEVSQDEDSPSELKRLKDEEIDGLIAQEAERLKELEDLRKNLERQHARLVKQTVEEDAE